MQSKFAVLIDYGMACVAATLIAYDDVVAFRQQVYHSALALVTPVDAYDCTVSHCYPPNLVSSRFMISA